MPSPTHDSEPLSIAEIELTRCIADLAWDPSSVRTLSAGALSPERREEIVDVAPFHLALGHGETDLFIETTRGALLVEVKILAGFQDRQAERYRKRAERWSRSSGLPAFTVLLAPEGFGRDKAHWLDRFDVAVALEELATSEAGNGDARRRIDDALRAYGGGFQGAKGNHPHLHSALFKALARLGSPLRPSPAAHTGDWVHIHCDLPGVDLDYRIVNGMFVAKAGSASSVDPVSLFDFPGPRTVRGSKISKPHSVLELDLSAEARAGRPTSAEVEMIARGISRLYGRIRSRYEALRRAQDVEGMTRTAIDPPRTRS